LLRIGHVLGQMVKEHDAELGIGQRGPESHGQRRGP
jgi:hypothetical protein